MNDYSAFVPNVQFEQIAIKNLVSNQDYQRNLSESHIINAAEHFDLYQINPVKVSRRDGVNYVFNGQHTIEIVALVSHSRDTPVWCMVYEDLDYASEADIFANQLKYTKALLPFEIFFANIEAGNDQQIIIKSLLDSYGITITNGKRPGGICAVGALEFIYERFGFHTLDRVIRLCLGTWDGDMAAFSANIMKGIAYIIDAYGDEMQDVLFKEKVGVHSLKELNRTSSERRAGSIGYAETMVLFYNARMKFGLSMQKLYKNKRLSNRGAYEVEAADEESEEESPFSDDLYQAHF